jgi:hypothetical protein
MALYDELKVQIDKIIAAAKAATADKTITLKEAVAVGMEVLDAVAILVKQIPNQSHEEKKAVLIQAANDFYSAVLAPIDIPGIPDFIESRFVDPALGNIFSKVAEGVIDWILFKIEGVK